MSHSPGEIERAVGFSPIRGQEWRRIWVDERTEPDRLVGIILPEMLGDRSLQVLDRSLVS
jgi:hypothetical protein